MRSTEIRIEGVDYDETATRFIARRGGPAMRCALSRSGPTPDSATEYARKLEEARRVASPARRTIPCCFSRCGPATRPISPTCCTSRAPTSAASACCAARVPAIPNAIAGLLLDLRDRTGSIPHAYFGWTEGNPITYLLKFLAFGEGDTAPVCREVLRQAEPDPEKRPRIHVG